MLLKDEPVSLIQAPTGIGKTYGYLLPALSQSKERQIVLSVPTKILQNQIMEEEGKRLKEVFHTDIHSLKGPQNYLKLDAFIIPCRKMMKIAYLDALKCKSWSGLLRQRQEIWMKSGNSTVTNIF